jgi:hypothetical protein
MLGITSQAVREATRGKNGPAMERSLAHKLFDERTPDVRLGENSLGLCADCGQGIATTIDASPHRLGASR